MSEANHYILTWQCPDTSGVLAKVTQVLFEHGAFITETCQYSDPYTETFFSRIAFDDRSLTVPIEEFSDAIKELADPLDMTFQLRERDNFPNIIIAVSKFLHFSQHFIVQKLPFTEFYLDYFFENIKNIYEIGKNLITNY